MHNEFLAFVEDEDSYSVAYDWATRQGFPATSVQQGGPDSLAHHLQSNVPPRLVLVDIDKSLEAMDKIKHIAGICGPTVKFVALGSKNDVTLYRNLISSGVSDYLIKPLTPEQLSQAMALVLRGDMGGPESSVKSANIIVFVGVRGGVGTSTLVVNTAWALAHEHKKQTALVDLDLQFGTSSLALDLEPGRGLRDLVSTPQRVDSLMIASSIVSIDDQLAVLSAEEGIDDFIMIDGSAVTTLMKEMRPDYDYVLVDLPKHMIPSHKRLLAAAHEVVLVTELSLVGIRDTLRIRTLFKSLGCPARVTVVATRINPQRPSQVDVATFEKGSQSKVNFSIPDDHKTVTAASNSGKSFVSTAPSTPISKAVKEVVLYLVGDEQKKHSPKKGLFGIFGAADKKGGSEKDEDGDVT